MKASRVGTGVSLAIATLTLYLGACASGSATPCGTNGVLNGTCQPGPSCPTGSTEISISSPFDNLACPSSSDPGGTQYLCCSAPVDTGVVPSSDGGQAADVTTPKMDATVGVDAKHPSDTGADVTAPSNDSGRGDSGSPDSSQVDSGQSDSGQSDGGQSDGGQVDGGHADAGADASNPNDSGHVDSGHVDGGNDGGQACEASGTCALVPDGQACSTGAQCQSASCVAGLCCNTACTGTCQACTAALTGVANGTCANVSAGTTAPAGQCTANPPCGDDGKCAAGGVCELAASGTACAGASCANAVETAAGACDGTGTCTVPGAVACPGGFVCASATTCKTACASSSDCAGMNVVCVNPGATGTCTAPTCSDGIQDGQETGVDCGGPTCGMCATVVIVAAGSGATYGGELHPTPGNSGSWSTTALGDSSVDPPSIAFMGSGASAQAVGVMHSAAGADLLEYVQWVPGTTSIAGSWTSFASVAAGLTTRKGPAIATAGSSVAMVFHGTDFNHYFDSFNGTVWAASEQVSSAGVVADGPTPAGIAALGSNDAVISYFLNAANTPQAQERITTWAPAVALGTDESFVARPSIVAMNGGTAELLVAYIRQSDGAVMYTTRTAGTWAGAAAIAGTSAHVDGSFGPVEYVGLAPLPSGGAVLAYRDAATGGIFYALYSGGAWSAPAPFASPNTTPIAAPALARGVAGAAVEMAYVDTDTVAYHTRFIGGAWTVPVAVVGSNFANVTIASGP